MIIPNSGMHAELNGASFACWFLVRLGLFSALGFFCWLIQPGDPIVRSEFEN